MYRWLLALLVVPAGLGLAGDSALDRATLHGLKAINIIVDPLDPEVERDGLSATALRIRIEDRLRKADIPIDTNAREFLGLHVTAVHAKRMPVGMCLALALYQPVVLSRDNKIRTATGTWNVETVMMSGEKVLQGSANSSLEELVDEFIRAYRSVNPK